MVGGGEAIKKHGRDNHQLLIATPVEDEVTNIAICSVLPIFDQRANFYGTNLLVHGSDLRPIGVPRP